MPELQRHPATVAIVRHFEFGHLPFELALVSSECRNLADAMVVRLPDGPELTAGLRKLLEAKDCFVRAAVEQRRAAEDAADLKLVQARMAADNGNRTPLSAVLDELGMTTNDLES